MTGKPVYFLNKFRSENIFIREALFELFPLAPDQIEHRELILAERSD